MGDPVIEKFRQQADELQRLKKLECRAADAWFDGLSPEQREVVEQLICSVDGINHLRKRIFKARCEAEMDAAIKRKEAAVKRKKRGG
jgi:hypothetical protein